MRICQRPKWISPKNWPTNSLLVSCCNSSKAPTPGYSFHNLPQVWVWDVLVSNICLLSRSPPSIVWRMFICESRLERHHQIPIKPIPGISKCLQSLIIPFFIDISERPLIEKLLIRRLIVNTLFPIVWRGTGSTWIKVLNHLTKQMKEVIDSILVIPPLHNVVQKQYHIKLKYIPPGGVGPDMVPPACAHHLKCKQCTFTHPLTCIWGDTTAASRGRCDTLLAVRPLWLPCQHKQARFTSFHTSVRLWQGITWNTNRK